MTQSELYLYRFTLEVDEVGTVPLVVLSTTDEQAFVDAEKELERSWFPTPTVNEWNLEEKKRIRKGAGYVFGHGDAV